MFRVIGGAVVYGLAIYGAAKLFEGPLAGVAFCAKGTGGHHQPVDAEAGEHPGNCTSVGDQGEAGPNPTI